MALTVYNLVLLTVKTVQLGTVDNNEEIGKPPNSSISLRSIAAQFKLGHSWVFQLDTDPKHTSKLVQEWIKQAINIKAKNRLNRSFYPQAVKLSNMPYTSNLIEG